MGDFFFFVASGLTGYSIYNQTETTSTTKEPSIKRSKPAYYRPLESKESEGLWNTINPQNVKSYEASALNKAPKTILKGPGGVKYIARTAPRHLKKR